MVDINKYKLSDKEREVWYNEVVKPCFIANKDKSSNPTFTLITGQSGAGKTTASLKIAENLETDPVKFGGDDIRLIHPYYNEIIENHFAEYPFITKPDMSWARQRLINDSLENGYNIQMDSILSNPNDWRMGTLLQAREAGYRIECLVLGVHKYLSEVSMFERCEKQKNVDGKGFPPTLEAHNLAYDLLPDIISKMYLEKVADKVIVCNRNFEIYYDTDAVEKPTVQAMRRGLYRSRQDYLVKESLESIRQSWENVQIMMLKRNASKEEYEQMQKCYRAFCENSGIDNKHNKTIGNVVFMLQQKNKIR